MIDSFIFDEIEKLPPLPETIKDLKNAYADEKSSAKDLEDIIKIDPVLVADILKVANSPYYGFSHEINDLRHAIVLFGFDEIVNFAIYSILKKSFDFDLSLYKISSNDFINLSTLKSKISKYLIDDKKNSKLLESSAFLSDIGKLIISKYAKIKNIEFDIDDISLIDIDRKEKEVFGYSTLDVTVSIFEKWNFDRKFVKIILESSNCNENSISNFLYSIRSVVTIKANLVDDFNIDCIDNKTLINAINAIKYK